MDPAPAPPSVSPPNPPAPAARFRTALLLAGAGFAAALGVVTLLRGHPSIRIFSLEDGATLAAAAGILVLVLAMPGILAGLGLEWLGRRGGWPSHHVRRVALAGQFLLSLGGSLAVLLAFASVNDRSRLKSMIPRQSAAAIDQFFLENPLRIFVRYDELIGPTRYIKFFNPEYGEIATQFPRRQHSLETLSVRLPDGTRVQRTEPLATVDRARGLVSTYPQPGGDQYHEDRTYRLDSGVTLRNWRLVDTPPDPAGGEGRDQDGVHVYELGDNRRYEVTYRGGQPDGPFRAYHADNTLWGEATYREGRVVEAWLVTRSGRRFNELTEGEAGQQALFADLEAASKSDRDRAAEKLRSKDYAGAVVDLTKALTVNPLDPALRQMRGDARKQTGDLDGAIDDWCAAQGYTPDTAAETMVPPHLRDAFIERGQRRRAQGDEAGARKDFLVVTRTAGWKAEELIRASGFEQALQTLNPAIELSPLAELLGQRAAALAALNRLAAAEADCTQALELVAAGRMNLMANARIFRAETHYQRGHFRRWLGRGPEAEEDFRAALPNLGTGTLVNQVDAACWLFVAQRELGKADAAARELAATDRSNWWPDAQSDARFLLGEITAEQLDAAVAKSSQDGERLKAALFAGLMLRFAGDEAGALARFRVAAGRSSHDPLTVAAAQREFWQLLRTLAERQLGRGDFAAAAATLKELRFGDRKVPASLFALQGDARRGAGDNPGALNSYSGVTTTLHQDLEPARLAEVRERVKALTEATRPTPTKPANPPTKSATPPVPPAQSEAIKLLNAGTIKLVQNDAAGALADFNRALELNPNNISLLNLRGDAYRRLGETDAALRDYTAVITKTPSSAAAVVARYQRGHLRRLQGDLAGAAADFQAGPTNDAKIWRFLTLAEAGRLEEARNELAAILDQQPRKVLINWKGLLAERLLGRLTAKQVEEVLVQEPARTQAIHRFEAQFYPNLLLHFTGDKAAAKAGLRQAMAIIPSDQFEWERAAADRLLGPDEPAR